MGYLIEEYRGDTADSIRYYHLVDSKMVRGTNLKNYYEDGSLFEVTPIENYEVKRTRSRKRRNE